MMFYLLLYIICLLVMYVANSIFCVICLYIVAISCKNQCIWYIVIMVYIQYAYAKLLATVWYQIFVSD